MRLIFMVYLEKQMKMKDLFLGEMDYEGSQLERKRPQGLCRKRV